MTGNRNKTTTGISMISVFVLIFCFSSCSSQPSDEDLRKGIAAHVPELLKIIDSTMSADRIDAVISGIRIGKPENFTGQKHWPVLARMIFGDKNDPENSLITFNLNAFAAYYENGELVISGSPRSRGFDFSQFEILDQTGSFNSPRISLTGFDRGKPFYSYDHYGIPINMIAPDRTVIAEFVSRDYAVTGVKIFFYIENRGTEGEARLKFSYSDNREVKLETEKTFRFLKVKKYKAEVDFNFKISMNITTATKEKKRISTFGIMLPDGTRDTVEFEIPSGLGNFTDITLVQID